MRVVGTAGHVDHGKSALVHALTGIDPDRLKEEKQRGMTIDLGFAWMELPPLEQAGPTTSVGIVDVPGHIDFIKNMLAGVGAIDAAILVIAADEGVMPQTREHLAILDLLAVPTAVVALTKVDKVDPVDGAEWLDLVELDIHDLLASTHLNQAPIVRVSALTGQGLDGLRAALAALLHDLPPRRDRGQPRLPIDRVFSLSGFGTVVTGTLSDGPLAVGETVEILPSGLTARIRGMQSHRQAVATAFPGSRVALNLTGVNQEELQRGAVVVRPQTFSPTTLLDVSFRLLPDAAGPLRHNTPVDLFVGATDTPAHARLLGAESLQPGQSGWVQLRLEHPVVVVAGDRFILRRPSPSATLGGGVVLDPHPRRRWRRFDAQTLNRLAVLAKGAPDEILLQTLDRMPFASTAALWTASGLDLATAQQVTADLRGSGAIVAIGAGDPVLLTAAQWRAAQGALTGMLSAYHQQYPLRRGMSRSDLRGRLASLVPSSQFDLRIFNERIRAAVAAGIVEADDSAVWLTGFGVKLSPEQTARAERLAAVLAEPSPSPPDVADVLSLLGGDAELLDMLIESGQVVRLGGDLIYSHAEFERLAEQAVAAITATGSITLAGARDLWQTSRKIAQALLEEMDSRKLTRRVGDVRVLR
jgi:selenocysteine-specific elongation factor